MRLDEIKTIVIPNTNIRIIQRPILCHNYIPRRHLLITGSALTVQVLWVRIGHAPLNGPDIQLHRTIVLKGNQSVVMQITRLKTYGKVVIAHVAAASLTKIHFGMTGEIMLYRTLYHTIPYKIRTIQLRKRRCIMTSTLGETKQTTVPENGSRRVPDDCQNRADTNVNPQNAAPQDSDKSTHSNGFNSSFDYDIAWMPIAIPRYWIPPPYMVPFYMPPFWPWYGPISNSVPAPNAGSW